MSSGGFSPDELSRLRSETPAWGRFAHFAHGSGSLPPLPVFEAQQTWLDAERRLGSHRAADFHGEALADVKTSIGRMLNVQPYQIALLDSASRAWSAAMGALLNAGKPVHVITTDLEYGANAIYLLLAARRSRLTFSILPARTSEKCLSQLVAEALHSLPAGATPVVTLPLVSSAWGVEIMGEELAREIACLVHERDGFLFIDASHAVGQLPVDMQALAGDVVVFPSRKWLRGPKGLGVLCLSDRALARFGPAEATDAGSARWSTATTVQLHSDARRLEGYEFNPGLRLALKAACDYAQEIGLDRIAAHNRSVRAAVVSALQERFGWQPLEAGAANATALMTYHLPDAESSLGPLVGRLWDAGVNVSVVASQHALWTLDAIGAQALLRLTPHYLTDAAEIDRLTYALERLQERA